MNDAIIETERLYIRHFRESDLDDFAALCADPVTMRYVGDGTPLPRDGVEHWIQVCQTKYATRGYGTSAVFEKTTGEFIGYCGVVRAPDNNFDEIIYVYKPSAWGKGYATEAGQAMLAYVFGVSKLDQIFATIVPENTPSRQVAVKIGMRFDRLHTWEDGEETAFYVIDCPTKIE
jgi:RimJ/RimL family protein N-acetyltransferase